MIDNERSKNRSFPSTTGPTEATSTTTTKRMMKNRGNMIETITVILVLVAIIAMSLYHISSKADFGLSVQAWHCIWSFSDTTLSILMCFLISHLSSGIIRRLFGWPLMLYFIFRGIYYLFNYCNVYVFDVWAWNGIMITPFLAGLICILIDYEREK